MAGRRGGSSKANRERKLRGHEIERKFAGSLGLSSEYLNDKTAKKDVIDPSGDAHSVKGWGKKWQIFLYGRSRFVKDDGFQALNGIGELLIHCIDAFPPTWDEYSSSDKDRFKERLRTPMRELKDRFQRKALLRAFLMKAIFNGGEVNYLSIYDADEDLFHVFENDDVVQAMGRVFTIENSKKVSANSKPEQKVLFRWNNKNVGELEMRNDSAVHYAQVRFNMICDQAMELLFSDTRISENTYQCSDQVIAYGAAVKRFWRWNT